MWEAIQVRSVMPGRAAGRSAGRQAADGHIQVRSVMPGRAAVATATLLLAAGCGQEQGSSASGAPSVPAELVPPPSGYHADSRSSPSAGLEDTTAILLLDVDTGRQSLTSLGFDHSAVGIYSSGQPFVIDLAVHFKLPAKAAAAAALELGAAQNAANAVVYDTDSVPGGRAYIIDSSVRSGGKFVYCQGIVFAVASTMYEIRQCGPTPTDGQGPLAVQMANAQYMRATQATG